MPDTFHIAITFDADPDFFDSSITEAAPGDSCGMSWSGVIEGIPRLRDALASYRDDFLQNLRATWFVRVDGEIAFNHGDPAYLLEEFAALWKSCRNDGHEIAWHPHLYRHSAGAWEQQTDESQLKNDLYELHTLIGSRGFVPKSSRVGEAYCSNAIITTLDELGIRCDSTAMPGRVRCDGERMLNWQGSPSRPYHPSGSDYRCPGADSCHLLEVPMSMISTKAEYDEQPRMRYVDLSFRHTAMADGLRSYLREADLLVTVTHPSTILPDLVQRPHGLLSFDLAEFRANLEFVFEQLRNLGRRYRFITVGECWELFSERAKRPLED